MGYTTEFRGRFILSAPLTEEQYNYLLTFSSTRRVKRNPEKLKGVPDSVREAVKLPLGKEGEYFVGYPNNLGQDNTPDVIEHNYPPSSQPGLWCQWVPSEDRQGIEWDGNEKFYNYVEWLEYIIENFLQPWGYALNGNVKWRGEEFSDLGTIYVSGNKIEVMGQGD